MTTKEIANKLVAYMRQGQIFEAQAELYADDIVCIEPEGAIVPHITKGKKAVAEKVNNQQEPVSKDSESK